jgi:hypothetical protein
MEPDTVATEPARRRPAVLESAAGGDLLVVDELLTEEDAPIRDWVRAFCDVSVLAILTIDMLGGNDQKRGGCRRWPGWNGSAPSP